MRLKKFLNESSESIDVLYRDCSQFMSEWKKVGLDNGLYRGMKETVQVKKFNATGYRFPKDTSFANSRFIDDIYRKSLGIELRGTSVFCTHIKGVAIVYGNPYYCVPVNNYKLYINPLVKDLYTDVFISDDRKLPVLCDFNQYLDSVKIAKETIGKDGIRLVDDTPLGRKLLVSARALLRPHLLTRSDKDRILYVLNAYLTHDKKIFEKLDFGKLFSKFKSSDSSKKNSDSELGVRITSEEAYEVFWKYAFENLEKKVIELIKKTKQVSLAESLNYRKNEIMLYCNEYYAVDLDLLKSLD